MQEEPHPVVEPAAIEEEEELSTSAMNLTDGIVVTKKQQGGGKKAAASDFALDEEEHDDGWQEHLLPKAKDGKPAYLLARAAKLNAHLEDRLARILADEDQTRRARMAKLEADLDRVSAMAQENKRRLAEVERWFVWGGGRDDLP